MTTERFLNTYHNASTAPSPDVPADLASYAGGTDALDDPGRSQPSTAGSEPPIVPPERRSL